MLLSCGASACRTSMVIGSAHLPVHGAPASLPDLDAGEACGPHSTTAAAACVDEQRLRRDVARVALPRPSGSAQHRAVRQHCADTLRALDYRVMLQDYGSGINVVGVKAGFSKHHEAVVVGAHYDQQPHCDGADDNA
ncbi:MAG TPA: hypothetical protein ENK23_07160, partial [Sorangium sp.]|nr:hypothetical protein [Sorangium sp.]